MKLELSDGAFTVDAALLGGLLQVCASDVKVLLRDNQITSVCERGEQEHAGQHRLTFFYKGRRARLTVDPAGTVMHRAVIDLGERRLPPSQQQSPKGREGTPGTPEES